MNLKDLNYFYDLSNLQSFTEVARKNGVSQPSISYAIKRLEKEFHCQLLVHDPSHRTFKLTPQGDILLRHVKKALPEMQGAQKEILRSLSSYNTIGFPPLIIDYLVRKEPAFIENASALRNIHPIQDGSIELLNLLSMGELDASFMGSLEPIIDKRFSVKTLMTTDDINLLKQLLRKKIGISLLSEIAITKEDKDLIAIPMVKDERMSLYVSLVTLKENNLHPEVENFFKELLN